jgi:transcriptional regulator with XRE-family HTH domain
MTHFPIKPCRIYIFYKIFDYPVKYFYHIFIEFWSEVLQGKELRDLLSANIRTYRNQNGFSQADLAEKAGISIPFLSAIECGNKWPRAETLASIATALNVEAFQLFRPINQEIKNVQAALGNVHAILGSAVQKALQELDQIR